MSNDPLSPARGIRNGVLLSVPIWAVIVALGVALAGQRNELKAPPPLPPKQSCLKVYGKPRCIPIDEALIEAYDLRSGQQVSAKTMFDIYDANERYRRNKLR